MDETVSYHFARVRQKRENRHEIDYQLTLRQQPKQSRMCGVGEKADRRPIDPPPIVQLKVIDPSLPPSERDAYLQNPYYFMYASLMAADLDEELHLLRDGKTRSTTGSVVSSLYHLKDIDNTDAGFFVFPDLSVRMEGSYRLKLSLFEIIGKEVFHCRSIISNKFFVYSAKKFPGMEESTFLSRSFADQGLKIRIRKELRQRRNKGKTVEPTENSYKKQKTVEREQSLPSLPHYTSHRNPRAYGKDQPTRYISYNQHPQTDQATAAAQAAVQAAAVTAVNWATPLIDTKYHPSSHHPSTPPPPPPPPPLISSSAPPLHHYHPQHDYPPSHSHYYATPSNHSTPPEIVTPHHAHPNNSLPIRRPDLTGKYLPL
ncbi:velvet factor-domain-containing protein [Blakeslea trispora]|nr:velvet factor-domain-containing protein [Blakeslea trispora]